MADTAHNQIQPGDVYAFWIERMGVYGAFQITGLQTDAESNHRKDRPDFAVLLLDWQSAQLPTQSDFSAMKPFVMDYFAWGGGSYHHYVDEDIPPDYVFICNAPPLSVLNEQAYGGLPTGFEHWYKAKWLKIPEALRTSYKTQKSNVRSITEDNVRQVLPEFQHIAELGAFPRLTELTWGTFTDELRLFLESDKMVDKLRLTGEQPGVIDLRGTGVTDLYINPNGVKEIRLTDYADRLTFTHAIRGELNVYEDEGGKFLNLGITEDSELPAGLPMLNQLHVSYIKDFDVTPICQAWPELRSLWLAGKPGNVRGLKALARLKKLEVFCGYDIFGFAQDEFPAPAELPALRKLWLDSIPAEAGKWIKKQYKPLAKQGTELTISKLRSEDWLAENRDNPFRDWQGDEDIPPSCAKKAFDVYRKTRSSLLGFDLADEGLQEKCIAVLREYIEAFNAMDRRHGFIDTLLREQISCDVLWPLLDEAKKRYGGAIDRDAVDTAVDECREF